MDHNLFLWYLRLPPAGVSSKDARHPLLGVHVTCSWHSSLEIETCFVEGAKVKKGMLFKMFQPDSYNPAVFHRYPKQGVALDYDGWVRLGYTDPIGDFASTLVLNLEMNPQELLYHVTTNPGRFHQQHVVALVHVDINRCYTKVLNVGQILRSNAL